jgi:hypothetical protein
MLATIDPKDSRTIALSTNPWGRAGGAVFVSRDDASHWTNVTGDLPNGTGMAAYVSVGPNQCYGLRYNAGNVCKRPSSLAFN